jgi:hypothetical protein
MAAKQQPPSYPYNDQHYELACQVVGACGQATAQIQRYKAAGFDQAGMPLDEMQQEVDKQVEIMQNFKKEFFPGRP